MKLYYTPGACSLAAHILLREAQLDFDLVAVDLETKTTEDGEDFTDINPKSQVPALRLDDGRLLTEVPVVVQYIADLAPDTGLAPAPDAPARYRLQEWLNFVTSEVHKGLSILFRTDLPEGWPEAVKQDAAKKFEFLERTLADNDYLLGNRFGAADSYAFSIINWTAMFSIDIAPWPHLRQYMQRIASRPAVRAAMQAEGLSAAWLSEPEGTRESEETREVGTQDA